MISESAWFDAGAGDDKLDVINRSIAELLGYTVENRKHTIALMRPDGSERTGFGSEEAAWWNVPEFSREVEPALTLWNTIPAEWTPRLVRLITPRGGELTFSYKASVLHNTTHEQIEGEALTPSRAICRMWLAWKEVQS